MLSIRLRGLEEHGSKSRGHDVLYASGSRVAIQFLQFLATLVLARILTPHAFGVVAIALVFSGFVSDLADLGIGMLLVRARKVDHSLVVTVFYVNLLTGLAVALLMTALAFPLAAAYHLPQLKLVLVIAGLQAALNVMVVPLSILERVFRFRLIAVVELACAGVGTAVSVGLALIGLGPISLVLGPLASIVLESAILWSVVRLSVAGRPTMARLREIARFCGPIVGAGSLKYWSQNVDNLVIGVISGPAALGVYSRAYGLMALPAQQTTWALSRVLTPTLSRYQGSVDKMRGAYLHALRLSTAVTIPAGAGLACLATPLTLVLLGQRWHAVAPLLQILAIGIPAALIVGTTTPVYIALDDMGAWARRSAVVALVTIVGLCLGAFWGPIGIATAWTLVSSATAAYTVWKPWRLMNLSVRAGTAGMVPQLASSLVMASCLVLLNQVAHGWKPVPWLASGIAAGAAIYVLVLAALDPTTVRGLWHAVMSRSGQVVAAERR